VTVRLPRRASDGPGSPEPTGIPGSPEPTAEARFASNDDLDHKV